MLNVYMLSDIGQMYKRRTGLQLLGLLNFIVRLHFNESVKEWGALCRLFCNVMYILQWLSHIPLKRILKLYKAFFHLWKFSYIYC